MTKIETLKLIITKSSSCAAEAGKAISAINTKSPAADLRCTRVALNALADQNVGWTDEERAIIADLMPETAEENREYTLRVRLTNSEQLELEKLAREAGVSLSEYTRRKIF